MKLTNEEVQEIVARAEDNYEMLKDKIHDLYDENKELQQEIERLKKREKELEENLLDILNISIDDNNKISEAIEYIENEMPCLWEIDKEWEDQEDNYHHTYKEYDTQILINKLKGADK